MAFESFGFAGKGATAVLNRLAKKWAVAKSVTVKKAEMIITAAIKTAILKGNANAIIARQHERRAGTRLGDVRLDDD